MLVLCEQVLLQKLIGAIVLNQGDDRQADQGKRVEETSDPSKKVQHCVDSSHIRDLLLRELNRDRCLQMLAVVELSAWLLGDAEAFILPMLIVLVQIG